MSYSDKALSKFLSFILRHKPQTIELPLDDGGWGSIEELINKANAHHVPITIEKLHRIVSTNDKRRFEFSEDGKRIRASQGHSIPVDLQLKEAIPPEILFHGTASRNIESIKVHGLLKGERHQVHLSHDRETALGVGARYGKPFVIRIAAGLMYKEGFTFYLSQNGVWLIDLVPPRYLIWD